jgi:glycolate oxidase iron-sulfur subunit
MAQTVIAAESLPDRKAAFESRVDYEHFLDCVHCGLCTASCPTYLELGAEADSPRGRIYLMRAVTDGRLTLTPDVTRHLDLCLDCRSCETACPSGVQYGRLIEPFRVALQKHTGAKSADWFHRWVLFPLFPHPGRMRAALWPARLMQWLRLDRVVDTLGLARWLPGPLRHMYAMLPRLRRSQPALPPRLPAKGTRRATVALFTGCIADVMFRHTHWATARVLQENGCDVLVPEGQTCCGAIHYHAGAEAPAVDRAIANATSIDPETVDAVVVNVAGCGAMLKDYPHLPIPAEHAQRVRRFSGKVRDVCEFLVELGPIAPAGPINVTATYHDACHLAHAQQVRAQPRRLLGLVPGLRLAPLDESDICCGAAGTYNLTQSEMAERLVDRKVGHILRTGAQAVIMGNAGCLLHIGRKLRQMDRRLWIGHPMEVLDYSYRQLQLPIS